MYTEIIKKLLAKNATEDNKFELRISQTINYYILSSLSCFSIPVTIKKLWTKYNSIFVETEKGQIVELEKSIYTKGEYYEERYPDTDILNILLS